MTRRSFFIFTLAVCISILGGAGILATASARDSGATAVVADEQAGIVRIMIDGRETVFIDANGLHVNGNIDYTGRIADVGSAAARDNKGR